MDKNRQYKIALVLYTQGIDYDDRIRKEMLSIMKLYPNVSFKIFAVEPKNREEEGVSSYGVPYRIPYLKTRDKYTSASHTLAKAWDFYISIKNDLKKYDAIWCADEETFLFALFINRKPILWDHHELPNRFTKSMPMRILFRYLTGKVKVMIHANEPRLRILEQQGLIKNMNNQYVLRNYPQFNEMDADYDETYNRFICWKGDSKCVYLQGLMGEGRADVESIKSVLKFPELKGVVVGNIHDNRMKLFESLFGKEELKSRIFFTGQQKQLKTPQYIKQCCMSLIFYKYTSPNEKYCEPNRLFQNLIVGNPVVVGSNPPMKELVEKYDVGVCVDTEGDDVDKICAGIKNVLVNYGTYKDNLKLLQDELLWDSQDVVIKQIIEKYL